LFIYQYDSFDMHIHYFESDGKQLLFGGVQGVYASGVGQYDTARARFAVGHFTRRTGPDQLASVYQYPSFKIRIHVFDPTPNGLQPVNGWTGVWESAEGTYDITKAKFAAADVDGDGLTDLLSFYWDGDGSVRVHAFLAANGLALVDTNGIAQFAPFTMPWLQTQVAAGDWNKDGKGDLATLTSLDDGSTHVGVLRSTGTALQWSANQWVTPTAELAASAACTECWPLNGMPASGPALQRRTLAVKIDNAPTGRALLGSLHDADGARRARLLRRLAAHDGSRLRGHGERQLRRRVPAARSGQRVLPHERRRQGRAAQPLHLDLRATCRGEHRGRRRRGGRPALGLPPQLRPSADRGRLPG